MPRKTFGPLKAKKCGKGKTCGGTCIAQSRVCRLALSGITSKASTTAAKVIKQKVNLGAVLGQGEFGAVYDDVTDSNVVHKIVGNGESLFGPYTKEEKDQLYFEEKSTLEALSGSGVSPKLLGYNDNTRRLTIEKIKGKTVGDVRREGGSESVWVDNSQSGLKALFSIHDEGYNHNDFHQQNQIVQPDGKVRAVDMGRATGDATYASKYLELIYVLDKFYYRDSYKSERAKDFERLTVDARRFNKREGIENISEDEAEKAYNQFRQAIETL